ncbi:repressor LexA [Lachnospiraceae bacterium C10]|jgi:repressor LexA|nr:repressor LexA [Lachnospiraceae bacterium C10]SDW02201.1 repressor LexA [Lachnospiraceae bacterium KHCPX20]
MSYGKISPKQQEILDFLKQEILNKGYPPSVREIGEAVNLKSTSSVFSHLNTLEKNGYIHRDPTKPRAIEIIDDNFNLVRREVVNMPLVGTVAAGQPLLAVSNIDNYFPIPSEYVPKEQTFMLRVKGESMINAGILDGDMIMVEQCRDAKNGDMVVALVDDSATVKTFYREDDHIRLQPENDQMDPILLPDCQILGKVFGVLRFF